MSTADLRLMRDGLVRLYGIFVARGDRRAADECIAVAQRITHELRPAALLAPAEPKP